MSRKFKDELCNKSGIPSRHHAEMFVEAVCRPRLKVQLSYFFAFFFEKHASFKSLLLLIWFIIYDKLLLTKNVTDFYFYSCSCWMLRAKFRLLRGNIYSENLQTSPPPHGLFVKKIKK